MSRQKQLSDAGPLKSKAAALGLGSQNGRLRVYIPLPQYLTSLRATVSQAAGHRQRRFDDTAVENGGVRISVATGSPFEAGPRDSRRLHGRIDPLYAEPDHE